MCKIKGLYIRFITAVFVCIPSYIFRGWTTIAQEIIIAKNNLPYRLKGLNTNEPTTNFIRVITISHNISLFLVLCTHLFKIYHKIITFNKMSKYNVFIHIFDKHFISWFKLFSYLSHSSCSFQIVNTKMCSHYTWCRLVQW